MARGYWFRLLRLVCLVPALRPCRSLTLSNGLKGPLPSSLGQLSALTQLTLNTNALNGTLPGPALGNLTSLQVLRLGSNALTGTTLVP